MTTPEPRLAAFLGRHIRELLAADPFAGWPMRRSLEEEGLPRKEVWYEFDGRGVEVICDEDERIRSIFLHRGGGEVVSDLSFALSRQRVLDHFGPAGCSGPVTRIPVLGDRGAWDRFIREDAVVHVQYRLDRDAIDQITLMRPDAVP